MPDFATMNSSLAAVSGARLKPDPREPDESFNRSRSFSLCPGHCLF